MSPTIFGIITNGKDPRRMSPRVFAMYRFYKFYRTLKSGSAIMGIGIER